MAISKNTTNEVVVDNTNKLDADTLQNGKAFWEKYGKMLTIALASVLALVVGIYAYKALVKEPKEKKANETIFAAENLFDAMANTNFNKDSVNLVLNGGNAGGQNITGLLRVINNYGGTSAANRANYMAGASYLNIGEYDKALKFLKEFDANGANQIAIQAEILIGQAYAEQKKTGEALDHFKKATTINAKDEGMTGNALFLAANYADQIGKADEAKDLFKKLKNDFPKHGSVQSGEVEKYLAKLGVFE